MILKKAEARKFDEYGKVTPKDEAARLDNFAIELMQDPTARGYIIVYSGRPSVAGYAQKTANRQKEYLVKNRGVYMERVVAIDGGARVQPATELWIAPSGAEPPKPSPTIKRAAKAKSPAKP
jgi:hypothetical protein